MREGVGAFVVPQPSVVSEIWLQCLLSGGECCFLISACSYLERSWCRVAAVVSASSVGSAVSCCFRWRFNRLGAASMALSCVCASLSLPCPVRRPALDQVVRCCPLVVPSSSSGVLGPSVGPQFALLSGNWETSRSSSLFSRLWLRFSSSHCWSLLHWRHLSVVQPASTSDRYLSGFRAGDCGLPLRRRVHARV